MRGLNIKILPVICVAFTKNEKALGSSNFVLAVIYNSYGESFIILINEYNIIFLKNIKIIYFKIFNLKLRKNKKRLYSTYPVNQPKVFKHA